MTTPLSEERLREIRERYVSGYATRWLDVGALLAEVDRLRAENAEGDAVMNRLLEVGMTNHGSLTAEIERLRAVVSDRDRALDIEEHGADQRREEIARLRTENANLASDAAVAKAFHDEALAELKFEVYRRELANARVEGLRARNATFRDMLERVQWGNTGACPECKRLPPTHAPDCALDAALRGAGE